MKSNTYPSGEVESGSVLGSYEAYLAFDNNPDTHWIGNTKILDGDSTTDTIQYRFTSPISVKKILYLPRFNTITTNITVSVSNDNVSWKDLKTVSSNINGGDNTHTYINVNNYDYYLYARLKITQKNVSGGYAYIPQVITIQFFGRSKK